MLPEKAVPHINEAGELVEPDRPNAGKFERFIFDALPLASNALIVEGNRDREFQSGQERRRQRFSCGLPGQQSRASEQAGLPQRV